MKIVKSPAGLGKDRRNTVLVIGNFDGFHKGHGTIIRHATAEADRRRGRCLVLTFQKHTASVLKHRPLPRPLMTNGDKVRYLESQDVDSVFFMRFDRRVAGMTAEGFIAFLYGSFRLSEVCVGENFRFGRANTGDIRTLKREGRRLGFSVRAFPVLRDKVLGRTISSTAIRDYLLSGKPEAAARMLGRPYEISSAIVRGLRLGSKIGFPTANFDPRRIRTLIPAEGVYAVVAVMAGVERRGLAYIGRRYAFRKRRLTIETHIPGWRPKRPLYGRMMTVRFLGRIRPPMRFDGPEALIKQMKKDIRDSKSRRF